MWMAQHVSLLGWEVFRLVDYLCLHPVNISVEVLQVSRVCQLPHDLGEFVDICKTINGTDKLAWITEHLAECKMVQKVSFEGLV